MNQTPFACQRNRVWLQKNTPASPGPASQSVTGRSSEIAAMTSEARRLGGTGEGRLARECPPDLEVEEATRAVTP